MSDQKKKFMDIWEIESHFRCPVVGAILSVEKHKDILKKCGYQVGQLKPYEYHQHLMAKLDSRNKVSNKVNNYLKSRSRKQRASVSGLSGDEIRDFWNQERETGNVGPAMFAIVSYEKTPVSLLHDIYGEVHMLAHANMTKVFDIQGELQKTAGLLEREKKRTSQKSEAIKQLGKYRKSDNRQIKALEKKNHQLENELKTSRHKTDTASQSHSMISELNHKISEMEQRLNDERQQRLADKKEIQRLAADNLNLKNESEFLARELNSLVDTFTSLAPPEIPDPVNCSLNDCTDDSCSRENCSQYQLCAKRVFMIGGLTKMKHYYKDIVEKAGGKFDYHDGYLKNAATNLEARVKRSDVVICPVNCNSHNACLRVKKLCNRYNKKLKILNSSSLSAISNALFSQEHESILN